MAICDEVHQCTPSHLTYSVLGLVILDNVRVNKNVVNYINNYGTKDSARTNFRYTFSKQMSIDSYIKEIKQAFMIHIDIHRSGKKHSL